MSLPEDRNQTVDSSSPLLPSTVNDVQDCIIGSKHKKRVVWGSPVAPSANAPDYVIPMSSSEPTGVEHWSFASGDRIIYKFPQLMPGTTVHRTIVRADTSGAGRLLTTKLWSRAGNSAPIQESTGIDHTGVSGDVDDAAEAYSVLVAANTRVYAIVNCLDASGGNPELFEVGVEISRL